jgi:hypothetical protein
MQTGSRATSDLHLVSTGCYFAEVKWPKLETDHVRFQVLTAASMKMTAVFDIAPCMLV